MSTIYVDRAVDGIARAIEAAVATNAAEVVIPHAPSFTYPLTRKVVATGWHGVVRGEGNGQHSTLALLTEQAGLDFIGAKRPVFRDFTISGNTGPAAAIVLARRLGGPSPGASCNGAIFRNVYIKGFFRVAPVVLLSCELARFENCAFANLTPKAAALVISNEDWFELGYMPSPSHAGKYTMSGVSFANTTLTVYGADAHCLQLSGGVVDVRGDVYCSAKVAGQAKVLLDCRKPPLSRGGSPSDVDLRIFEEGSTPLVRQTYAEGSGPMRRVSIVGTDGGQFRSEP